MLDLIDGKRLKPKHFHVTMFRCIQCGIFGKFQTNETKNTEKKKGK